MFVSVIIPTFNRLELLKRAVASIEAQSYKDYELIIVDDGSSDGTAAFLASIEHQSILLETNQGVSAARNRGAAAAKGEWIAFLDSDDTWHKNKLAEQVAFHQQNSQVKCSFGIEQWFRLDKEVKRPKKYEAPNIVNFQDLLEFTFIGPSSVMIDTKFYNDLKGFDEDLAVCEDFDLWLRLSKLTPMYLASKVTINKHAGDFEQLSSSVLSLEPFRVEALLKHRTDVRVRDMIVKKLGIIKKGALKHSNQELLEFCEVQAKKLT